jgi:hypothetical protein
VKNLAVLAYSTTNFGASALAKFGHGSPSRMVILIEAHQSRVRLWQSRGVIIRHPAAKATAYALQHAPTSVLVEAPPVNQIGERGLGDRARSIEYPVGG